MRFRRPIETVTARSASDRFFTGRLTIVDVRSDTDVVSIDGGMNAWMAANLPTARCSAPYVGRRTG